MSGAARKAGRPRGGFSLVELLVVIAILGMVSGIAWVSWQALLPNQKLNSAVRQLSDVLYGTRAEAIARNREFRIYYDLDKETFVVRTPYSTEGGYAVAEDEPHVWVDDSNLAEAGLEIESVTIDDRTYDDGTVFVRFDPLGASSYHVIVLRQPLFDRAFTIEVLPITGEIRFHDGYHERDLAEERDFE